MSAIIIPILTAFIGAFLAYIFGVKAKKDEAMHKYKEEKYAKLLLSLQGFVGDTANAKTKKVFFDEQYQSWLYCSDEVVEAMNAMVGLVVQGQGRNPDPESGRKAVGNIVVAMRKDLLGKTSLDYKAFRYTNVVDERS